MLTNNVDSATFNSLNNHQLSNASADNETTRNAVRNDLLR